MRWSKRCFKILLVTPTLPRTLCAPSVPRPKATLRRDRTSNIRCRGGIRGLGDPETPIYSCLHPSTVTLSPSSLPFYSSIPFLLFLTTVPPVPSFLLRRLPFFLTFTFEKKASPYTALDAFILLLEHFSIFFFFQIPFLEPDSRCSRSRSLPPPSSASPPVSPISQVLRCIMRGVR